MRITKNDRVIIQKIKDAGGEFHSLPTSSFTPQSVYLNKMGSILEKLKQNPSKPVLEALKPFKEALVGDTYLKNDNKEIQVSVACCFSEIMRLTVPNHPYEDQEMKEHLQLCVTVFKELNLSGRFYKKAVSMLGNLAKVKACLIMLSLNMDEEIAKMFQYFFESAAGYIQLTVLAHMECIMTTVIIDSDELPTELIKLFLDNLKMERESNRRNAGRLGEKLLKNCFNTLKNYIPAAELMHIHPSSFAEINCKVLSEKHHLEVNALAPGHAKASGSTSVISVHDEHGQKLVQCKHASADIIEVKGYKVKARNALILEKIMSKYGDVASECSYKSAVLKSSVLDVVCDTVQRLHHIIPAPEDLNELECIIDDMEAAKVHIGWLRQELENKKAEQTGVMLRETNRGVLQVAKAVEITLKYRKAELATAQQRFEEAERSFEALKCVKLKVEADIFHNQAFLGKKRSRCMI